MDWKEAGERQASAEMTLRDYFAAMAMQAMLGSYPCQAVDDDEGGIKADFPSIAGDAYDAADAMLEQRAQLGT